MSTPADQRHAPEGVLPRRVVEGLARLGRSDLLRRRRTFALGLVAGVGMGVVALTQGVLPSGVDRSGSDQEAVVAAVEVPPPPDPEPPRRVPVPPPPDVAGEQALGDRPSEPCRPDPGVGALASGAAVRGGAALGASALGCSVPAWKALPGTALEIEDPAMLLAQVTREQAVEPREYAPADLVLVRGGPYQLREEVAVQLEGLLVTAERAGHPHLVVTSGFRSFQTQAGTFEDWVGTLGQERAQMVSARPGHSEHQLGLAVDLGGSCHYQCFGTAPDGRWVAENAHRWGFIVRYPEGGEGVTGYAWEPWHLRYVGPRAAWGMHLADEPYWETFQPVAARAAGLD